MPKLTPKIILEGTRLTFKTDIAFALNDHPRIVGPRKYKYHSPLISAEWCTFTNFPWGRGPINFEPQEESLAMETYATWARMFELQRYYSWIVDRFHLSTRAYQLTPIKKIMTFAGLKNALCRLVFIWSCSRAHQNLLKPRTERLKVSGNPAQYDNLDIFIEEQELMRRLVRESMLPVLELDMSNNTVETATEHIADWMESTGGLYMST